MKTQIDLLKEYKIAVKGHLGQHLLIDPNVQKKIVDLLDLKTGEWVLEVGPGLGALTGEILSRGANAMVVEKDSRFCGILEETFAEETAAGRLIVRQGDILKFDLGQALRFERGLEIRKVVSNLPYYITGPVLFKIFSCHRMLDSAVFMMQQEVAQRIFAEPSTKDYGRLSLAVRLYGDARHAFDVSRHCFTPPPEVKSTVIKVGFHHQLEKLLGSVPEQKVLDLIQTAFSHRRKKMLTILNSFGPGRKSRAELEAIFNRHKFPLSARPEELMFKDFIELARELSGGEQV